MSKRRRFFHILLDTCLSSVFFSVSWHFALNDLIWRSWISAAIGVVWSILAAMNILRITRTNTPLTSESSLASTIVDECNVDTPELEESHQEA